MDTEGLKSVKKSQRGVVPPWHGATEAWCHAFRIGAYVM